MKVKCPLMMCKHNSSFEKGKSGYCQKEDDISLYIEDLDIFDDITDEIKDKCLMSCYDFEWSNYKENN